jgi:hypothetical protein
MKVQYIPILSEFLLGITCPKCHYDITKDEKKLLTEEKSKDMFYKPDICPLCGVSLEWI